ncbi:MAG TPA: cytochrome c maturation protein CcmE [Thermaerobacter sp.]
MSVRMKVGAAVLVVLAGIAYLSLMGFQSAKTYYLSVDQALGRADELQGRFVRVHGRVAPGTVDWTVHDVTLAFAMAGESGRSLPVVYKGVKPDLLQDGVDVVVEGRLEGDTLVADRVMVKCPSKYQAASTQPS